MTDAAIKSKTGQVSGRKPALSARVISLLSSHDRREAVKQNFQNFPYDWSFFEALTGESPSDLRESPERQISHFGRRLGPAEVGVFKSHVSLLDEFERTPDGEWLLVLEDDVWLDVQFPFDEIIAVLEQKGAHYLRLFARRHKPADVLMNIGPRQIIRYRTDPYGAQAYLINKTGVRRFRQAFDTIDRPVDDELGRFWVHGLEIYSIFPFPAVERGASLIQTDRGQAQRTPRRFNLVLQINRARAYFEKRIYNLRRRLSPLR